MKKIKKELKKVLNESLYCTPDETKEKIDIVLSKIKNDGNISKYRIGDINFINNMTIGQIYYQKINEDKIRVLDYTIQVEVSINTLMRKWSSSATVPKENRR